MKLVKEVIIGLSHGECLGKANVMKGVLSLWLSAGGIGDQKKRDDLGHGEVTCQVVAQISGG